MNGKEYEKVCYLIEQRDEHVRVRNLKTGKVGYSFGCTREGETIQVELEDHGLDSWSRKECRELTH